MSETYESAVVKMVEEKLREHPYKNYWGCGGCLQLMTLVKWHEHVSAIIAQEAAKLARERVEGIEPLDLNFNGHHQHGYAMAKNRLIVAFRGDARKGDAE